MPKITLVLHNIRSTHNVGSIFRSAEGFGVERIVLSGYTPYPKLANDPRLPHIADKLDAQIAKTALGAEKMVPFIYVDDLQAWLDDRADTPLLALEQADDSINLRDYVAPEKFTLLLGEEVHGIEPWLLERATTTLEIPMYGHKESFNVSVATGIALYALTANV